MNSSNFLKVFLRCFLLLQLSSVTLAVVGGKSATIDNIPFIVQIRSNGKLHCGGSLITESLVLTAGHCVTNIVLNNLVVVGGATKTNGEGIESKVTHITLADEFEPNTLHMDMAVMKLAKPFTTIKKANFCKKSIKTGTKGQVFGWGSTRKGVKGLSEQLQTCDVTVQAYDECVKINKNEVTSSMFCSKALQIGPYDGDSGGPLLCEGCLCGIISWSLEHTGTEFYHFYTNFKYVIPFIEKQIRLISKL